MKTIRKTILALFLLTGINGLTQNSPSMAPLATGTTYKTAIGIRGGETSGLTFKQFINQSNAIKGILGGWRNGFSATLLFEHYETAFNTPGLNWYYGAGGHVSASSSRAYFYRDNDRFYRYTNGAVGLGVDGIVGLEYAIPKIPFAISLDVKPYAEVVTNGNIWLSIDPGLGIKVTF